MKMSSIENPFIDFLGIANQSMDEARATLTLDLHPHHMNSWQITHGGVSMSMLDVVMAMAARAVFQDQKAVVTLEMKTSFLQPAGRCGAQIRAHGQVCHQTATLCFCEAELWNGDKLAAKASGTYQYLRHPQAALALQKIS